MLSIVSTTTVSKSVFSTGFVLLHPVSKNNVVVKIICFILIFDFL